jgi:TolB-like protein
MSGDADRANSKPPSLDRLSLLWRRINDHKIAQWIIAYVALAYGVQHAVTLTSEAFEWPHAVERLSMLLLVLGVPVVMTLAWYHGARASRRISGPELSILSVLLVGVSILFYVFVRPSAELASPAVQQAGVVAARQASLSPAGAISIAVLPFTNLSGDSTQEFFSDGMTEEITSALAKIPDLRVVGRTSAFQFKGQNQDLRAIGQALSATHLLEGSVRKAGTRVRITAELINADGGVSVWTDSYDRDLTDVFAIQEEIARSIAGALRMPLRLKPGERLVSNRPADQETYDLYLRGLAALRSRSRQELELLGQVVARDPNFAPGWAMLSEARLEMALYFERRGEESKRGPLLEGAEAAARKAIALAPGYAGGYAALAGVTSRRGKWVEAIDLYNQGLARDPEDPELLNTHGETLRVLGYLKEALRVRERVALLEPLIPLYNRQRAELLLANGMTDAGLSELLRLKDNGGIIIDLPAAYAQRGRFAEAADMLMLALLARAQPSGAFTRPQIEAALQVLRAAANRTNPPTRLPDFGEGLNFVYAYTSTPERMLDWPEKALKDGDYRPLQSLWWPTPSSVRKTERFKTLMRKAGIVDYWRAKRWPDLCHPTTGDDFACN